MDVSPAEYFKSYKKAVGFNSQNDAKMSAVLINSIVAIADDKLKHINTCKRTPKADFETVIGDKSALKVNLDVKA